MYAPHLLLSLLSLLPGVLPSSLFADDPAPVQNRKDAHGDPLPPGALVRLGSARLRHSDCVTCVAFANGGASVIAGSSDGFVTIWDATSGKASRSFQAYPEEVRSLVVTPDNKSLITGSLGGALKQWDLESGKEVRVLGTESDAIEAVALSTDGSVVAAACRDHTIGVYATATGNFLHRLKGHSNGVACLAFAPRG